MPAVVGMDRNGTKSERWQAAMTERLPEDPAHFLDDDVSHGRRDVLDRWFTSNPGRPRPRTALPGGLREGGDGDRQVIDAR
jgi:hypothetical protein